MFLADDSSWFVTWTNELVRFSLYVLLLIAAGAVPLIEQPMSSLLFHHDRMRWLFKTLRRRNISVLLLKEARTLNLQCMQVSNT